MLGPEARVEDVQALRRNLGLDRPLAAQYLLYLGRVLHGDLGESIENRRSATELITERPPVTLTPALGMTTLVARLHGQAIKRTAGRSAGSGGVQAINQARANKARAKEMAGVSAPLIFPDGCSQMRLTEHLLPSGPGRWLGTDVFGRDLLVRLVYGSQASGMVGVVSVATGAGLRSILGALVGCFGSWADHIIMRVMDAVYSFPAVLPAMALVSVLRTGSWARGSST